MPPELPSTFCHCPDAKYRRLNKPDELMPLAPEHDRHRSRLIDTHDATVRRQPVPAIVHAGRARRPCRYSTKTISVGRGGSFRRRLCGPGPSFSISLHVTSAMPSKPVPQRAVQTPFSSDSLALNLLSITCSGSTWALRPYPLATPSAPSQSPKGF